MRRATADPTAGISILAGARAAAARTDTLIPAEIMAKWNELAGAGALDTLPPAAAWAEIERALAAPAPWRFIEVLRDCGALERLWPELDLLFGVPQPACQHPEIDAGAHALLTLRQMAAVTGDPALRLAALLHDIGKAATPRDEWPLHHNHGRLGVRLIERMAARLQWPARFRELAALGSRHHGAAQKITTLPGAEVRTLFAAVGSRDRLEALVLVCQADHRGRHGYERTAWPEADLLRAAWRKLAA